MKAALYPNFQKKNALACARDVCGILISEGITVSVSKEFREQFEDIAEVVYEPVEYSAKAADLVIAIGGDGTILRCAKYLIGTSTKLLGINTGTLGFMAGLEADQLDKLKKLKTGDYNVSDRMTLSAVIHTPDGDRIYTALNDICIKSKNLKICDFEVLSDGYLIGRYRADGILFSSPSGSTAYALSAGGPVIEPDLECIEMTLICPHSLFSRTTLFSAERSLTFRDTTFDSERPMCITVDGDTCIELRNGQSIEICKGSKKVKFIDLIGNSFHESLCRKMMKPIK